MPRQLLFVQFPHSGYEHALANWRDFSKGISPVIKQWNTNSYHRRKFMHLSGEYLDNGTAVTSDEIYCWGEWEPTSFVEQTHNPKADGLKIPKYVHIPVLSQVFLQKYGGSNFSNSIAITNNLLSQNIKGKQNTDPFIFGQHFLYSCCRQWIRSRITKLQNLDKGSIIIFGSSYNKTSFVVDTVFVVEDFRTFRNSTADKDLHGFVPRCYSKGIMRYCNPKNNSSSICYLGKMYNNNLDEPFCFVPCKVGKNNKIGFARPTINISLVNPKSYRSYKTTPISAPDSIQVWKDIRDQIINQGFNLGIKF